MPVGEMLKRMSARELSEWEAYELANGPLGRGYNDKALAEIHEQLQTQNILMSLQFTDPDVLKEIAKQVHYPRPAELYQEPEVEEEEIFDPANPRHMAKFQRS